MKSPAKKKVSKAKVKVQISPLQSAQQLVDSVKKQVAAHNSEVFCI